MGRGEDKYESDTSEEAEETDIVEVVSLLNEDQPDSNEETLKNSDFKEIENAIDLKHSSTETSNMTDHSQTEIELLSEENIVEEVVHTIIPEKPEKLSKMEILDDSQPRCDYSENESYTSKDEDETETVQEVTYFDENQPDS